LISIIGSLLLLPEFIWQFSSFNSFRLFPSSEAFFWATIVLSPGEFLSMLSFMGPQRDISFFEILRAWGFGLVISLVIYFIIGAVIGWIYGKIKNRN